MAAMSHPGAEATATVPPRLRVGAYRPASAAAALGWWVVSILVGWIAAALTGVLVGAVAMAAADDRDEWADLGAVVLGLAAAVATAYLLLVAAAVLLARRYVPPQRRSTWWLALLVVVLLGGAVLMGAAFVALDQLTIVLVGTGVAILVPVLVVTRMRPAGEPAPV